MFGVITATVVVNMRQVEGHIVLIKEGYVPLALKSKELNNRQDDLANYLEKQLSEESNAMLAKANVNRYRMARDRELANTRQVLEDLERQHEVDPKQFTQTKPRIEALENQIARVAPLYDEMLAAPPLAAAPLVAFEPLTQQILDAFLVAGRLRDPKREAAVAALYKLRTEEHKIYQNAKQLSVELETRVRTMTGLLKDNEHTLLVWTIYLGSAAVLLGLLVSVWVVITLRPLRRLRDGARRIAAGDYASRIPEKGPAEVAELAREFNSMGRAIEERERDLVRSERLAAVGKMAAMITHEVRNPLSSIGLNTELLEDELASDASEARDLCRSIHREVDRLTAITEEYLALGRLPKAKLAAEPINPIVDALVVFVREDLAAKRVTLATDLAAGDPIAQIDAGQIRQCLINLVRNAAEAVSAHGGGTVTLRTRALPSRIEIAVEDDGVGIPTEIQTKLFDPFFSTKEGGSGLGLALTQQIVRDHGGDLRVESAVGRGTTFTVSVPTGGPSRVDRLTVHT